MRPGALIFQTIVKSDKDKAISASGGNAMLINHVGIFAGEGKVISAIPDGGVKEMNIRAFESGATIQIVRNIRDGCLVPAAIARAKGFIGRPYNTTFLPNQPGLYCSELVTESFLYSCGRRYFPLCELRFDDEKFWRKYYKELGMKIPFGSKGSHPAQLLAQDLFENAGR